MDPVKDKSQSEPVKEEQKDAEPVDKFFLVLVGDDAADEPQLIESDSLEAFTKSVDENVLSAKTTLHAFGFVGQRIQISAPAPVCMVEVNGKRAEVGRDNTSFEASGRITPLRRGDAD